MKPWQNPSFLELLKLAVLEDLQIGDTTSDLLIPQNDIYSAKIVAKSACIVCGQHVAKAVFTSIDNSVSFELIHEDGTDVQAGTTISKITGPARSILAGERIALNFMQRMSGIATQTHELVQRIADTDCRVVDTRKTLPGHRILDKYAVRTGGGQNHRMNLGDGVLIKENHIAAAGGIAAAVHAAKAKARHSLKIQVEVENLNEVDDAISAGADALLLDNMSPETVKTIVEKHGKTVVLESSGNITRDTIQAYALAGVNIISVGALTHSVIAADLSLLFQ